MRRTVITAIAVCLVSFAFAQTDTTIQLKKKAGPERANDHFLLQIGYTGWTNKPDSVRTSGLPRTFNLYLMLDFPFKTNPHWSVALGPGIATDNIYFSKSYIGIRDNNSTIRFQDMSDTNHYKKYKLATAYLEAPIELRYRFNAADDRRSVKLALGAKIGTLLNAHVKGKDLQDKNGTTLNSYIEKENSKRFFNKNRLSLMGRVGYGHYSLFASYAVTPLFKEGAGPDVRPLTFGLTISGL